MVERPAMVGPEADLVHLAVCGDQDAVALVLADIRPLVVRYCLARLGAIDGGYSHAEDVAQEVCLTVLRVLPRYRDQGRPFAAFVYGIAARKVSEATRAARRQRQIPLDSLTGQPDPADGPEQLAVAADMSARLHRMLSYLPSAQREVIVLRVAVGLTANQTAAILGTSATAVRTAQHRSLKKLRTLAVETLDEVIR